MNNNQQSDMNIRRSIAEQEIEVLVEVREFECYPCHISLPTHVQSVLSPSRKNSVVMQDS